MKNILLFLLKPEQFYNNIAEGKLKLSIVFIIIIYSLVFIFSEIKISDPLDYKFAIFFLDNDAVAAFSNLIIDLSIFLILAAVIYLVSKTITSSIPFISILLNVFSLKLISLFILLAKIGLFYIVASASGKFYWGAIEFSIQIIYLFIGLRNILEISSVKTIMVQCGSLIIMGLIAFGFLFLKDAFHSMNSFSQGQKYFDALKYENAIEYFNESVKDDPNNPLYNYYLAESLRKYLLTHPELLIGKDKREGRNIIKKAEMAYKKALTINTNYLDARIGLGYLYLLIDRYEDSIYQFKKVVNADPDNHEVASEISKIYQKLNKPELEKKHLKRSSNNIREEGNQKNSFKLFFVNKIKLQEERCVVIESSIIWRIAYNTLYDRNIGSKIVAESRIKDIYHAILRNTLMIFNNKKVTDFTSNEIINEITNECNRSILKKNFGLEIFKLALSQNDC